MKIYHNNKVYVQKKDFVYALKFKILLLPSIYDKLTLPVANDEYLEFSLPSEVKFIKEMAWILDYNEYICLSKEEFHIVVEALIQKMNDAALRYNQAIYHNEDANFEDRQDYMKYSYMINTCRQIYRHKYENKELHLPSFDETMKLNRKYPSH